MCEFVSWIEKDDKVYFLTSNQLFRTTRGKAAMAHAGSSDDYCKQAAFWDLFAQPKKRIKTWR